MAQIVRTIGGEMLHCTRVVGMCVYVVTIGGGNDTASCLVAGACADGVGKELFFRHQRVREEHCPCTDIECLWVRVCVCVRAHTQYAYVRSQKSVNDVHACPCAAAAQKGTRGRGGWAGKRRREVGRQNQGPGVVGAYTCIPSPPSAPLLPPRSTDPRCGGSRGEACCACTPPSTLPLVPSPSPPRQPAHACEPCEPRACPV
mmetsp:Transcript_76923/g.112633  ORF Transcript_76923/g.112633 Transcript_76923/m.112633 type:complete len:202 (+) Transcript_76923:314-919(+)